MFLIGVENQGSCNDKIHQLIQLYLLFQDLYMYVCEVRSGSKKLIELPRNLNHPEMLLIFFSFAAFTEMNIPEAKHV